MEKTKRKNMRKSIKNNEKGITLVALVVTIVVLLILAGVTLSMVVGENGIITKAKEARDKMAEAQHNDQLALNEMEGWLNKLLGDNSNSTEEPPTEPEQPEEPEQDKIVDGVKIPVGFYYVGGTKVSGLVISDDVADNEKYKDKSEVGTNLVGNQFVWIPVEDYSKFHLIEGYQSNRLQTMLSAETNPSREAGSETTTGTPLEKNSTPGTVESIALYKSVKDNKGFYIARYEAGIDEKDADGNPVDNNSLATKIVENGTVKPLSKANLGVWNYILWGGTSDKNEATDGMQGNDNADGAVKVARSMYTKSSTCGVTSTLCYGVQWDAVMNFIDHGYVNGNINSSSFVMGSSKEWVVGNSENESRTVHGTGYHAVNNIYDLGGNVCELTMESYNTNCRITRGGFYGNSSPWFPSSVRLMVKPDVRDEANGFRVTLYL